MSEPTAKDPDKTAAAASQARDLTGKFSKFDPPLVSFSITNPVTYLRQWWKGVMAGEGVDIKLKIRPMTAVMIVLAIGGVSFGIGRISIPEPVIHYIPILATPQPTVLPTPNPWKQAAFVGILQKQGERYYLVGTDTQAIVLEPPTNVILTKLVGKRILAVGLYDQSIKVLRVEIASDFEIISGSQPVPTSSPSPSPTHTPLPPAPEL